MNETKQRAIQALREKLPQHRPHLLAIDPRLAEYFDDLANGSSAEEFDTKDRHNLYEVLGGLKFLRLLATYDFDAKKVQKVIRLREGEWQQHGNTWEHQFGGLPQPGTGGPTVYRWQPFQVFILASVFGFVADVPDGMGGSDKRRLCTDFTFYSPRKVD